MRPSVVFSTYYMAQAQSKKELISAKYLTCLDVKRGQRRKHTLLKCTTCIKSLPDDKF